MAASEKDIEETMQLFQQNAASLLKTVPGANAILLSNTAPVNTNLSKVSSAKSNSSTSRSPKSVATGVVDIGLPSSKCSNSRVNFLPDYLKSTKALNVAGKPAASISPVSLASTVRSGVTVHHVTVDEQESVKSVKKYVADTTHEKGSEQGHLYVQDEQIPTDLHSTNKSSLGEKKSSSGSGSVEKNKKKSKHKGDHEPIFGCHTTREVQRRNDMHDACGNLLNKSADTKIEHIPGSIEYRETFVKAFNCDDLQSSQKVISDSPGVTSDPRDVQNGNASDFNAPVRTPDQSFYVDETTAACQSDVPITGCDVNLKGQGCLDPIEVEPVKSQTANGRPAVEILRAVNLRRKVTPIVSFTTEDFDLFHKTIGKSQTMGSMKESLASDSSVGSGGTRLTRRCSISLDTSTRRASDLHADKAGNENNAHISTHQDQDQTSYVKNQTNPVDLVKSIPAQPAASVQQLFESSLLPVQQGKLVRRKTIKNKVTRKSTRRHADDRRHIGTLHPNVDDDFNSADGVNEVGEEQLDFSETDSENEKENGSSTDESDLEFEGQLAEQIYSNQQVVTMTCSGGGVSAPVVTMSRPQRIANELLETERNYVKRLHLVDQVFHFKVVLANREHHMFPNEVVPQIFSNIKSIYQFHHDFLLPQLEKRILTWDTEPCIGDVMRKFAPFLKLYSEYVKNFDNAMNTMTGWMDKSTRLLSIVQEIQKQPECCGLSLQHHMLEPIQRVPRYELLLKDYLKHLSADSPDREDTQKALELVMTAASHSNEAMRKMDKFRKLLDINESLGGELNLVSPTRELVKEGKIVRMSARNGDHYERYLLLFNDLFLVCKSLPLNIGHRQQYHVKSMMTIEELEIAEGDNLAVPNTFYVKGMQKSLELHLNTMEEKIEWQEAIMNVIEEYARKKRSRRLASVQCIEDGPLGWRAPTWVKDQETSMCMRCSVAFTVLRRRHHCRACGKVVCAKCSSKKAPLAYLENQKQRVCDACCEMLIRRDSSLSCDVPTSPSIADKRKAPPLILQKKGNEPSVLSGYLMMCCDKHSWQRRWFAVHKDFVLYSFKAHQDVVALTSMPLPGYQVSAVDETEVENHERVFKVHHSTQKKIYYFQADDKSVRNRWLDVLVKVVQLEIPQETPR